MSDDCNNIFCDGGELSIPQPAVPVAPVVPLPNVPVGGGGGGGVNCGEYVSSWAQTCALTKSGCPRNMCNTCPDAIDSQIRSCCDADLPYTCFDSVLNGGPAGSGMPATTTDLNLAACETAVAYVSICESLTTDFASLAASDQASCLCYDASSNFVASSFDDAWGACVAYASTADTSDYSFFSANEGFCASVGSGAAASSSPSTTVGSSSESSAASTISAQSGGTLTADTPAATSTPSNIASASASASQSTGNGSALSKPQLLPFCVAIVGLAGVITSFL